MRALFKPSAAPGLEMIECAEPTPGPTDVKIRVEKTGICGTDLHIESWDAWAASAVNAPLIIEVTSLELGALVSGEGHIICGTCRNCRAGRRHMCKNTSGVGVNRNGAFAEYVVIPASNVWVHSDAVDAELGAIFDPFGNAVHTALTFPVAGEDVLITGAGPIGLMAAKVARHVGARYVVISDINESRLELARSMGVDIAVNPMTSSIAATQKTLGMKEGFDVALEMSGAPTALPDILDNLSHGGRVAVLGLPSKEISINWAKLVTHMITIKGIYGREMYETWYAMNSLIQTGLDIRDVITDRFPASEWENAFAAARSSNSGKVIMDWS
jgi:threonine 3-dehydrogenase